MGHPAAAVPIAGSEGSRAGVVPVYTGFGGMGGLQQTSAPGDFEPVLGHLKGDRYEDVGETAPQAEWPQSLNILGSHQLWMAKWGI